MTERLKRILCIDDDTDILDVAKMCLETLGGFETIQPDETLRANLPDLGILP